MMKFSHLLLLPILWLAVALQAPAEHLVILHTNDTHSAIEPSADGSGGILRRKAIIDSVRGAERNVILVDAGDMVQGSLYFKFWRGDVEYPLFNMMDYDIRILGNHEFDNGLAELARHWRDVKANRLSANYDFTGTPAEGLFKPYVVKEIGGRRIGFIGLNVDPASLISAENYKGMVFKDVQQTADSIARLLRTEENCDLVVAVTHIGYDKQYGKISDVDLARASRDIDIIIGGHSHTTVDPEHPEVNACFVDNADGRPVLIAQTGKYGRNIGYIDIDLDRLPAASSRDFSYRLLPVAPPSASFRPDARMLAFLEPYAHKVDSVNHRVIARSAQEMKAERNGAYANFTGDFGLAYGRHVADSINAAGGSFPHVDFAVMNVGGIRQDMKEGPVTEGQVLSTFPFSNHVVIMEETGADIIAALQAPAPAGGEAVSSNVEVVCDAGGRILRMYVDGQEIEPDRKYVMATIDYVAAGNDNMTPFARGRMLWRDSVEMCAPMMRYIEDFTRRGVPLNANPVGRFFTEVSL